MKFKEETKFNIRLETVAGGIRTEFKGIKLNTLFLINHYHKDND